MFPMIEFPELAQHYAPYFVNVFSVEAFVQLQLLRYTPHGQLWPATSGDQP